MVNCTAWTCWVRVIGGRPPPQLHLSRYNPELTFGHCIFLGTRPGMWASTGPHWVSSTTGWWDAIMLIPQGAKHCQLNNDRSSVVILESTKKKVKEKQKHKASTAQEAWRWTRQITDNTATSEFSARAIHEEWRKMASGKWLYSWAHLTIQGGAGAARRAGKRASMKSWCFRPEQQDMKQTNKPTARKDTKCQTKRTHIISMALVPESARLQP